MSIDILTITTMILWLGSISLGLLIHNSLLDKIDRKIDELKIYLLKLKQADIIKEYE